uniref:PH domain-containing protein n=1 Tax=Rhabditophanes sp. KR3021 TaxID=114890 RepID=A0AC35TW73_9BILA
MNNLINNIAADPSQTKRLAGFLNKVENRMLIKSKKKYWFITSDDSPFLYWYKSQSDLEACGRFLLTSSAFTFNPTDAGIFEIKNGKDVLALEAENSKERMKWLKQLQYTRGACISGRRRDDPSDNLPDIGEGEPEDDTASTFYLDVNGSLQNNSFEDPKKLEKGNTLEESVASIINVVEHIPNRACSFSKDTKNRAVTLENKIKKVVSNVTKSSENAQLCSKCSVNSQKAEQYLKSITSFEDIVDSQQRTIEEQELIISSLKEQNASLMVSLQSEEDVSLQEKSVMTQLLNEKNDNLTNRMELKRLRQKVKYLHSQAEGLQDQLRNNMVTMQAYEESIETKNALILKIYDEQDKKRETTPNTNASAPTSSFSYEYLPEGIEVDFEGDRSVSKLFDETGCTDVNQLKDLLEGYMSQNNFLNQEILQLQENLKIVNDKEHILRRRNFDIEAYFCRLKRKIIDLLMEEGRRSEHFSDADASIAFVRDDNSQVVERETDILGYFVTKRSNNPQDNDIMAKAANLARKANVITEKLGKEDSKEYIEWIQKWDSFMLNHADKPLIQNNDFKLLLRTSIPHAYRTKIWNYLVQKLVKNIKLECGNGYYQSLLQNAADLKIDLYTQNICPQTDESVFDSVCKIIDWDLARTLPTNKNFCDNKSEKIPELRRVLYAYRFYNKEVGYCQGLNRLAAIALLYLKEEDAFWFMVACIDKLQPEGYYTTKLSGAIADQSVFLELVHEKLPKLASHLKCLDVDLPLHALSWFMTIYVDALSHDLYLKIFDIFLYEGNKVLFRIGLSLLKLCENDLLACKTFCSVHDCLSKLSEKDIDFKVLSQIAFHTMNPFPTKAIENKRNTYLMSLEETEDLNMSS